MVQNKESQRSMTSTTHTITCNACRAHLPKMKPPRVNRVAVRFVRDGFAFCVCLNCGAEFQVNESRTNNPADVTADSLRRDAVPVQPEGGNDVIRLSDDPLRRSESRCVRREARGPG